MRSIAYQLMNGQLIVHKEKDAFDKIHDLKTGSDRSIGPSTRAKTGPIDHKNPFYY